MKNRAIQINALEQKFKLTSMVHHAISLLQMNKQELELTVMQMIQNNIFIEENDSLIEESSDGDDEIQMFETQSRDNNKTSFSYEMADEESFYEKLFKQIDLLKFNSSEMEIAEFIIHNLDENGFLAQDYQIKNTYFNRISYPETLFEQVRKKIMMDCDPIGVACLGQQEFFLIQIQCMKNKLESNLYDILINLIENQYHEIMSFSFEKIIRKLKHKEYFDKALKIIFHLKKYPVMQSIDFNIGNDIDIFLKKSNQEWKIFVSSSIENRISLNNQYIQTIKNSIAGNFHNREFFINEINEANCFIQALKRRHETLTRVAQYIVKYQSEFMEKGFLYLKPLNIKQVADDLKVHESTVSRITTGKYMLTPHGVFELKDFFPTRVQIGNDMALSDVKIKKMIEQIILDESQENILSDVEIAKELAEKNICISRRTVAKYREELLIPSSYMREKIKKSFVSIARK